MAKKKRKDRKGKAAAPAAPESSSETSTGSGIPAVPLWAPVVLFVLLTVVLFREFIFSDQMLFGNDTLGLGYVARDFYADALKDLGTFLRLLYRMGVRRSYRGLFWRTLAKLVRRNPRGLRYSVALLALYLHFGDFRSFLVARLGEEIRAAEHAETPQPAPAQRRLAV